MGLFEFLFAIFLVTTVVAVAGVGLSIWGISRGAKALGRRLKGRQGTQGRVGAPPQPRQVASAATSPQSQQARVRPVRQQGAMRDYEYFDVDKGSKPSQISAAMEAYVDDYVVGSYAQAVIDALESVEFRRKSLLPEIESKFERDTISWDRFVGPASEAIDAVVRNSALLANRVQSFDSVDYARMEQFYSSGGFDANGNQDPVRLQRWKLLYDTKREMDGIQAASEGLLLELGKLASELGKLSSAEFHADNERIAEEVSRLVEETKYYR